MTILSPFDYAESSDQRAIYDALGADPHAGGVRKTII